MNIRYFLIILLFAGFFTSCKKDQVMVFDDVARLQFGQSPELFYRPQYDFNDTLKRKTFVYDSPEKLVDTVFFDLYTVGKASQKDRLFSLKQEEISGVNNAIPGKHYIAFDDPSVQELYTIKANTNHLRVPIIVLRDPGLKNETVVLKIVVAANENFQLGEPTKIWRRLEVTDQLSQPSSWDDWMTTYMFGKYSVVKHSFMIEKTGEKWDEDFMSGLSADISLINFYKAILKTELIEYNKAHPGEPLTDEFGDPVIFP